MPPPFLGLLWSCISCKERVPLDVEVIKIRDINAGFEYMLESYVKGQFVIDEASLKA